MDFQSALVWLQGVGVAFLLLVAIGWALKKAGVIDSIWGLISKFVDWTIWVFNTVVVAAPGFIKVGVFLILFSLIGSFIAPLTIGVYAVCDSTGEVWTTDDFFEGFSAQTLPGGLLSQIQGKKIEINSETGLMAGRGPLVDVSDGEEGVLAVSGDKSSKYVICKYEDGCHAIRSTATGPTTGAICTGARGGVFQNTQTVAIYFYEDVEYVDEDAGDEYYSLNGEEIISLGDTESDGAPLACPEVPGSIPVAFEYPERALWWKIFFFDFGSEGGEWSGHVVGAVATSAEKAAVLNKNKYSALRVKDSFINREGSGFTRGGGEESEVITYSCEEGDKKVFIFGADVFNPVFMFLIVVVGGLIVLLIKLR